MYCYFFMLFSFTFGGRIPHPPFVLFFSINIFTCGFLSKKIYIYFLLERTSKDFHGQILIKNFRTKAK